MEENKGCGCGCGAGSGCGCGCGAGSGCGLGACLASKVHFPTNSTLDLLTTALVTS